MSILGFRFQTGFFQKSIGNWIHQTKASKVNVEFLFIFLKNQPKIRVLTFQKPNPISTGKGVDFRSGFRAHSGLKFSASKNSRVNWGRSCGRPRFSVLHGKRIRS